MKTSPTDDDFIFSEFLLETDKANPDISPGTPEPFSPSMSDSRMSIMSIQTCSETDVSSLGSLVDEGETSDISVHGNQISILHDNFVRSIRSDQGDKGVTSANFSKQASGFYMDDMGLRRRGTAAERDCNIFNLDVLDEIMSWLHLSDLALLGMASTLFRKTVQHRVTSFMNGLLNNIGVDPLKLFSLLHHTQSVVSGSFALRCLFPGSRILNYAPCDLDIYVPREAEVAVLEFLRREFGYETRKWVPMCYYVAGIHQVFWLTGSTRGVINVVVASGRSPLLPLFNFHSTMVMNFISSTGIYSAYNDLTKSLHYIPNNPAHLTTPTAKDLVKLAMVKYKARGFTIRSHHMHRCGLSPSCPLTVRSLTDRGSFFFTFSNRPWIRDQEEVCQIFNLF